MDILATNVYLYRTNSLKHSLEVYYGEWRHFNVLVTYLEIQIFRDLISRHSIISKTKPWIYSITISYQTLLSCLRLAKKLFERNCDIFHCRNIVESHFRCSGHNKVVVGVMQKTPPNEIKLACWLFIVVISLGS